MHKCKNKGSLLLEVLIGAALLAVGILACLRVFSASIYSTQRLVRDQKLTQLMDGTLYQWFSNPVGFDPEKVGALHSDDSLIDIRVSSESLNDQAAAKKNAGTNLQVPTTIEFFKMTLAPKYGRMSLSEEEVYLFTYGKQKKSS